MLAATGEGVKGKLRRKLAWLVGDEELQKQEVSQTFNIELRSGICDSLIETPWKKGGSLTAHFCVE